MRKERGITLIALIITIIILLLLAGVALNALSGEYGILKEAQYAVDKYNEEVAEEQTILDSINQWLNQQQAEPVYAKVYKVTDDEYHLVFNKTGNVAQGYTADQEVYATGDIVNGFVENGWENYEEYITKAIIEEKIKPTSTSYYFYGLWNMTEIVNLSNLDTRNVTDMSYMFCYTTELEEINVSSFDTSKVTNMSYMFGTGPYEWPSNLTEIKGLDKLNTSKVTDMSYMFSRCANLENINLSNFDTSNVTTMKGMFSSCCSLTEIDVSGFDTSKVTNMSYMFGTEDYYYPMYNLTEIKGLNKLNTSKVTDMSGMFANCFALENIDLTNFNTSNVTDMSGMFGSCCSLTEVDISGFDTSKVTNMSYMFGSISGWDAMENLTEIVGIETLNTSKVTDMRGMFITCSKLTSLDLSNFNTSNVTDMSCMFYECRGITAIDVSSFDTSNVEAMSTMFYKCRGITAIDVSSFNTSKVTDMWGMFAYCENLVTIYVSEKWTVASLTYSDEMFNGSPSLVGAISYDETKTDATYANYTTGYLTYKASE